MFSFPVYYLLEFEGLKRKEKVLGEASLIPLGMNCVGSGWRGIKLQLQQQSGLDQIAEGKDCSGKG